MHILFFLQQLAAALDDEGLADFALGDLLAFHILAVLKTKLESTAFPGDVVEFAQSEAAPQPLLSRTHRSRQ